MKLFLNRKGTIIKSFTILLIILLINSIFIFAPEGEGEAPPTPEDPWKNADGSDIDINKITADDFLAKANSLNQGESSIQGWQKSEEKFAQWATHQPEKANAFINDWISQKEGSKFPRLPENNALLKQYMGHLVTNLQNNAYSDGTTKSAQDYLAAKSTFKSIDSGTATNTKVTLPEGAKIVVRRDGKDYISIPGLNKKDLLYPVDNFKPVSVEGKEGLQLELDTTEFNGNKALVMHAGHASDFKSYGQNVYESNGNGPIYFFTESKSWNRPAVAMNGEVKVNGEITKIPEHGAIEIVFEGKEGQTKEPRNIHYFSHDGQSVKPNTMIDIKGAPIVDPVKLRLFLSDRGLDGSLPVTFTFAKAGSKVGNGPPVLKIENPTERHIKERRLDIEARDGAGVEIEHKSKDTKTLVRTYSDYTVVEDKSGDKEVKSGWRTRRISLDYADVQDIQLGSKHRAPGTVLAYTTKEFYLPDGFGKFDTKKSEELTDQSQFHATGRVRVENDEDALRIETHNDGLLFGKNEKTTSAALRDKHGNIPLKISDGPLKPTVIRDIVDESRLKESVTIVAKNSEAVEDAKRDLSAVIAPSRADSKRITVLDTTANPTTDKPATIAYFAGRADGTTLVTDNELEDEVYTQDKNSNDNPVSGGVKRAGWWPFKSKITIPDGRVEKSVDDNGAASYKISTGKITSESGFADKAVRSTPLLISELAVLTPYTLPTLALEPLGTKLDIGEFETKKNILGKETTKLSNGITFTQVLAGQTVPFTETQKNEETLPTRLFVFGQSTHKEANSGIGDVSLGNELPLLHTLSDVTIPALKMEDGKTQSIFATQSSKETDKIVKDDNIARIELNRDQIPTGYHVRKYNGNHYLYSDKDEDIPESYERVTPNRIFQKDVIFYRGVRVLAAKDSLLDTKERSYGGGALERAGYSVTYANNLPDGGGYDIASGSGLKAGEAIKNANTGEIPVLQLTDSSSKEKIEENGPRQVLNVYNRNLFGGKPLKPESYNGGARDIRVINVKANQIDSPDDFKRLAENNGIGPNDKVFWNIDYTGSKTDIANIRYYHAEYARKYILGRKS